MPSYEPRKRPAALRSDPYSQGAADVVLIGYQDQGNLGMGYLAAVLKQLGREVDMIDIRDSAESIAARLTSRQPLVVGFSLIFQYFLPQYRSLATHLRNAGITSHFTIGGHYPSLCHDEILQNFPELDSVVRYEGELTLPDLVERLSTGNDWRQTSGLSMRWPGCRNRAKSAGPRPRLAAPSVAPVQGGTGWRVSNAAVTCQPRLRATLFFLFDSYFLSHRPRQGGPLPQA
jgi:radical SAM superfamily enzyme YgiQ (UPF0313 family)